MDNIKNDNYYINKIKTDLEFILDKMNNTSIDEFSNNLVLQDSMMFRMIQISENAKMLTDEYKNNHSTIR